MAPPIGGVDKGGRRRDLSLTDMAAISGSWVSYIFTNLANFRTPESERDTMSNHNFVLKIFSLHELHGMGILAVLLQYFHVFLAWIV